MTIEDAYELFPTQANVVALNADRHSQGERTPTRLLEASLRMRPDRIILGELRGEESRTFLEAINTGHGGSFTTVHADTARKAIDRLAIMVMAAGLGMGFEEVKRYCEGSVDLVVQLERRGGVRGGGNYVRLSETTGSSVGIRIHPLQPPVLFFFMAFIWLISEVSIPPYLARHL